MPLSAADGPTITRIDALPAPYGVTAYFRFFPKPERPSVFVKITCEDGSVGWGQSVPIPTWSYECPGCDDLKMLRVGIKDNELHLHASPDNDHHLDWLTSIKTRQPAARQPRSDTARVAHAWWRMPP